MEKKQDNNHVTRLHHIFNTPLETGYVQQKAQCRNLDRTKWNAWKQDCWQGATLIQMRKDCTSQQFFRCYTNSKLVLWRISPAFPSSREIPSLPANSRGTEQQIPLTWTLRRQLGYCESLTAGNNPTNFGDSPNSVQYPPPCTLVHKSQQIGKESQRCCYSLL